MFKNNIQKLIHKLELIDLTEQREIQYFREQLINSGLEQNKIHNENHDQNCNCSEYLYKIQLFLKIIKYLETLP